MSLGRALSIMRASLPLSLLGIGLIATFAMFTYIAFGQDWASAQLGLDFSRVRRGGDFVDVFSNNLRVTLLPFGAAYLVSTHKNRWLRLGLDVGLAAVLSINMFLLGIAVTGYGMDALSYLAPHIPFELVGLMVAYETYLRARQGNMRIGDAVMPVFICVCLLFMAALIESGVIG